MLVKILRNLTMIFTFVMCFSFNYAYAAADRVWTKNIENSLNKIKDITYGNSTYVTVGKDGTILFSKNGTDWQYALSNTPYTLNKIIYYNNEFIAVGTGNTVLKSKDGVNWNKVNIDTKADFSSIAYNGKILVIVGSDNTICTSENGDSWSKVDLGQMSFPQLETNTLHDVIWANNKFIAVGGPTSASYGYVLQSDDGVNWSKNDLVHEPLENIYYIKGTFIGRSRLGQCYLSKDCINWSRYDMKDTSNMDIDFDYSYDTDGTLPKRGKFIAICNDTVLFYNTGQYNYNNLNFYKYYNNKFFRIGEAATISISEDGMNWSDVFPKNVFIPYDVELNSICFNGKKYYAFGRFCRTLVSEDGINWTKIDSNEFKDSDICSAVWFKNKFVAIISSKICVSEDGLNWRTIKELSGSYDKFYVVNNKLYLPEESEFLCSEDGENWSTISQEDGIGDIQGIASNGNVFVVVGGGGRMKTSKDFKNWTTTPWPTKMGFVGVVWNGEYFAAVGSSCDGNFILKSYDGLSWDFVDSNINSMPDLSTYDSFIFNGKEFICADTGGLIISSKDLVTWYKEESNTTNNLNDIISNGNTTIAVGYGSTIITAKDEKDSTSSSDNVKEFKEATFNDKNKTFSIKFTRDANFEECEKYICVSKDPFGNEILKDVKLTLGSSDNIINISAPPKGYENGIYYIIIKPGFSEKGNDVKKIKKTIRMKFNITDTQ